MQHKPIGFKTATLSVMAAMVRAFPHALHARYMYACAYVCMYVCTHTHARTHARTNTRTQAHARTRARARTHTTQGPGGLTKPPGEMPIEHMSAITPTEVLRWPYPRAEEANR